MNPIILISAEVAVFGLVVLAVFALGRRVESEFVVRRRLRGEAKAPERSTSDSLVRAQDPRNSVLAWVQNSSLKDPKERQTLRRDLARAGFEGQSAPAIYVVVRFCLAAGLPVAFIFGQRFLEKPVTGLMSF